jgi:hypothetical protein
LNQAAANKEIDMALIPLNTFKTKTRVLDTNTTATAYVAPIGVTSIVLMAQVSNTDPDAVHSITFSHHRRFRVLPDAQGNNAQDPNVTTELVKNFIVPPNDSASLITGKMILEAQDSIRAYSDTAGSMKLVLSILETANT